MSKKDYYEILGVSKNSSQDEIKKSYRKIALKFHPDRNPGNKDAEEKFKEAAEAYEILSNTEKRQKYDQFGHSGMQGGADYHNFSDINDIFESFGDIFGNIFGGGARSRQSRRSGPTAQKGHDLGQKISISLKEAFLGCKKEIRIYLYSFCDTCSGTGCSAATKPEQCSSCSGSGQSTSRQGFFMFSQPCSRCNGQGFYIPSPCSTCKGQSRIRKYNKLIVNIPAGIYNDAELRVAGKGDSGVFGGPPGDLYITILIENNKKFFRKDNDLVTNLMLTYPQLVLGSQIEVEGIDDNKVAVKIPKGCKVGGEIIVPGKGFKNLHGRGSGNMVIIAQCDIPRKLSGDASSLLKKYSDKIGEETQAEEGGISWFFKRFLG